MGSQTTSPCVCQAAGPSLPRLSRGLGVSVTVPGSVPHPGDVPGDGGVLVPRCLGWRWAGFLTWRGDGKMNEGVVWGWEMER